MWAKRRVPALRRSHPAVSTARCGPDARLPLPKTTERAILHPTTTGEPGNVELEIGRECRDSCDHESNRDA
jgi:hypothetical protein